MKGINERGIWLRRDGAGHRFDGVLAGAIAMFLRGECAGRVLDLGCGKGDYVKVLRRVGIHADGVDGNPHTQELSGGICSVADLTLQQDFGAYEWVLSLEVGEHIPAEYEQTFLDNVTRHAEMGVIISWAIPGQPGKGHVNCRDNSWLAVQMSHRGFLYEQEATALLRLFPGGCPWLQQTLMLFTRQ